MIPIIDTHQHLWDLSRFRLPWLDGGGPLARSYLPEEYAAATEGLPVVKTVYMEVDVDPAQHEQEAEYVVGLCADPASPMAAAVIGGRLASERFPEYACRFARSPYVKGIRQVLHGPTPAGYCLQEAFVAGIRLLGELGLSFDLCLRPTELVDGAKLARLCPDTRFILDHCGNADVQARNRSQWQRDIEEIARCPNMVCKVSGIVASAKPGAWSAEDLSPIVNHTVEVFGRDRIMFGGDWPVCTLAATLRQWIGAIQAIVSSWPEPDRRALFHDNATRFYGIA